MPRTRCPHCQAIQSFEEEERGATKQCSSCEGTYRAPAAAKDKAVQRVPKPQPKAETAGRGAAKDRPPDEEDVAELDEVVAADDDEDEDEQQEEEKERPRKRRAKKDEDDDKPRRKKRRRRSAPGFSLVDTLPIDYISQVNIGVGIFILVQVAAYIASRVVGGPLQLLTSLLLFPAFLCYLWGCAAYAKSKNYTQWLGLLGLLWLVGLVILVCLPRRSEPEDGP